MSSTSSMDHWYSSQMIAVRDVWYGDLQDGLFLRAPCSHLSCSPYIHKKNHIQNKPPDGADVTTNISLPAKQRRWWNCKVFNRISTHFIILFLCIMIIIGSIVSFLKQHFTHHSLFLFSLPIITVLSFWCCNLKDTKWLHLPRTLKDRRLFRFT